MEHNPFDAFVWSVGEEGSDPVVTRDGQNFRQDQFAQSGHYEHLESDLHAIADLGVTIVRYGTPWRLAEPTPGHYDWTLWDRALAACERSGLEPVVELVHFGLPDHYGGFADTAWVDGFCRYVDAFIDRYRDHRFFTPINEPGVTALLSARFGLWNDRLSSEADHARALVNVTTANLEALARLQADREAWWVGSEGFSINEGDDEPATRRRNLEWLVWDLHFGTPLPTTHHRYFDPVGDDLLDRLQSLVASDRLIAGLDVYPATIRPAAGSADDLSIDARMALVVAELRRWYGRYQQPFWIAETSNLSLPVDDQVPWLDAFSNALGTLREQGLPARGLCWYSRGDQFDWQTALTNPVGAVTEVGLFDTARRPREVATRFAELAAAPLPPGQGAGVAST